MSTATPRDTPAPSTGAATGRRRRTKRNAAGTEPVVSGNQRARIELVPDGEPHPAWPAIVDFLERVGVQLDPWQLRVLWVSLLRRADGWAARRIGVCAPRQNGKNVILAARELVGAYMLGEKMIVHSAHLADTSMEHFRYLDNLIDDNDWLADSVKHIRRQNGHEQISFANTTRSRIRFRTRTGGGGRGFGASPLVLDEAMYLSVLSFASMRPVITAQPEPQVWLTGSAVDQQTMPDGLVFAKLRENAFTETDDEDSGSIAYFEWSLDYDNPDDVPMDLMLSTEAMEACNPAFGKRITRQDILDELKDFPDPRTAAVERFGVGDWPQAHGLNTIFDLDLWASLVDENSEPVGSVVYSFDVRPDRSRSVIAAVGRRADGYLTAEIGEQREGTSWLIDRLEHLERTKFPIGIVCDGVGPAASLVPELLQRNITVIPLTTPQVGEACGMFFDAVQEGRIRHRNQPELLHAIKGAVQRPLGDRWAWSRRNSTSDISPLVACTLGMWKLITEEQHAPLFAFG